jgi:phosphotransferase system enzyme I (PtsI)
MADDRSAAADRSGSSASTGSTGSTASTGSKASTGSTASTTSIRSGSQPAGFAVFEGVGVGTGAVAGPVARLGQAPPMPPDNAATGSPEEETVKAFAALAAVAEDLRARGAAAGGETNDVLGAQAMMAEDPGLADGIAGRTAAGKSAARAIYETFGDYRELLGHAGVYVAARVADLDDIGARAVALATGIPMPGLPVRDTPYVLVARDLAPADTALLDIALVLALVTAEGGPTSHTAILARSRGIPAVVGAAGVLTLTDDVPVLVDAAAGTVVAHPTADLLDDAESRVAAASAAALVGPTTGPGRTADGRPVALLANVGGVSDVAAATAAGAEGVGLFRTEFLYLGSDLPPTQEAQVYAYQGVFDGFPPGSRVVIRTLDAGADKPLPFLPLGWEPNPALGVRGLRAFRGVHEGMLRTQLTAIKAAIDASETAGCGVDVWVMAPMVNDAEEATWFAALAADVGLDVSGGKVGVMVETPAAALSAGPILAGVCGFASIGTNDLTQYTMAADRMLGAVGAYQDPWHPAVLKLIGATGQAGKEHDKPVGVCGEAASDPLLACVLVGLGVSSLSMAPSTITEVRAALAARTYEDCVAMAERALTGTTAREARRAAARSA